MIVNIIFSHSLQMNHSSDPSTSCSTEHISAYLVRTPQTSLWVNDFSSSFQKNQYHKQHLLALVVFEKVMFPKFPALAKLSVMSPWRREGESSSMDDGSQSPQHHIQPIEPIWIAKLKKEKIQTIWTISTMSWMVNSTFQMYPKSK